MIIEVPFKHFAVKKNLPHLHYEFFLYLECFFIIIMYRWKSLTPASSEDFPIPTACHKIKFPSIIYQLQRPLYLYFFCFMHFTTVTFTFIINYHCHHHYHYHLHYLYFFYLPILDDFRLFVMFFKGCYPFLQYWYRRVHHLYHCLLFFNGLILPHVSKLSANFFVRGTYPNGIYIFLWQLVFFYPSLLEIKIY